MTISAARREFLRRIGRQGGKARARMPDFIEHQRRAGRRSAQVDDMATLGRRGAAVTARRRSYDFAFEKARRWRIEHPSRHERVVMDILDELGVCYEREAKPISDELIAVDFVLPGNRVIEVDGEVHYDPMFDPDGQRRARDTVRLEKLRAAGFQVLVIDHRELGKPQTGQQIAQFCKDDASGQLTTKISGSQYVAERTSGEGHHPGT